jgi:hypothetical protein
MPLFPAVAKLVTPTFIIHCILLYIALELNLMSALGTMYHTDSNFTRMYPNVSGLAAWSKNFKWYSSLPLGEVVSLFCESVS